jgi:8-oxo-dGTP pyrophosphatase MutT (NUDIX family)
MIPKTIFVVGLVTDPQATQALLIKRAAPGPLQWLLNGLGGRARPGESPASAMRREAQQEAGVSIGSWIEVGIKEGRDYKIHFFTNGEPVSTTIKPGRDANPKDEVAWQEAIAGPMMVDDLAYVIEHIRLSKRFKLRIQPFYITEQAFVPKPTHAKSGEPLDTIV